MNTYFILIFWALWSAIISSINSVYIKNIDILTVLFIQYATTIIGSICIYFYLSKEQTTQLYTKEYSHLWIYHSLTSIIGVLSWYYYYNCVNIIGPSKSHIVWSITKTIALFIISIYILSNTKLNYNIIIGIILSIAGIYILESNSNYI